jgi:hypothetical protein
VNALIRDRDTVLGTYRLCSWARVAPRTVQSGRKNGRARTGKGNPYLKAALAQIATGAAKTDTFLGGRYRRLIKRMPKAKALVPLQRSILIIFFHLLADPTAEFTRPRIRLLGQAARSRPPYHPPAAPAARPGLPGPTHRRRRITLTTPTGHQRWPGQPVPDAALTPSRAVGPVRPSPAWLSGQSV